MTRPDRFSNKVSLIIGSWKYVACQMIFVIVWIFANTYSPKPVDPPPYILLNLILSFQGEFSASFIIMSQRAMDAIERMHLFNMEKKLDKIYKNLVDPTNTDEIGLVGMKKEEDRELIKERYRAASIGDKVGDFLSTHMRSWSYICILLSCFATWLSVNGTIAHPVDPFPYFWLNLTLSTIASQNVIIIILSTNSQILVDRRNIVKLRFKMDAIYKQFYAQLMGEDGQQSEQNHLTMTNTSQNHLTITNTSLPSQNNRMDISRINPMEIVTDV